ncbi:MAG: DUF1211 domain-containing protein, partial [Rhodospirillales bacterium]|nr:DUF1211 domain-containing protein [Rhodospirillales bacterium]
MMRELGSAAPREGLSLERIVFFSDAVIAIAITLLAIEIRLPELGHEGGESLLGAITGLWPRYLSFVISFFVIGSKAANDAGMEAVRVRRSKDALKRMLEQSGYKGETLVLMHPTDQVVYHAMTTVAADAFRQIGVEVDEQMTDWGTIVQRRPSKAPLDKGG